MKARKKSVIVEAVQWKDNNTQEILDFCNGNCVEKARGAYLYVTTLEGGHIASVDDYIIKGVNGEFYPCKPDIFEKTYDVVDDDEIDLQLTIEEINALICYISKSIGVFDADLLNTLKLAYMLGEENLSLCINAIDKLQKQKEELKNELQQRD